MGIVRKSVTEGNKLTETRIETSKNEVKVTEKVYEKAGFFGGWNKVSETNVTKKK